MVWWWWGSENALNQPTDVVESPKNSCLSVSQKPGIISPTTLIYLLYKDNRNYFWRFSFSPRLHKRQADSWFQQYVLYMCQIFMDATGPEKMLFS